MSEVAGGRRADTGAHVKRLVVLKGSAGSGKSTLGRALARHLRWPLIDKDDIKDVLHEHCPDAGPLSYEVMFRIARTQLLLGASVVCDSPLADHRAYEHAVRIVEETEALLAVIECECSDEAAWQQRIEGRKALRLPSHHQTDWQVFHAMRPSVEGRARYPITHPHLVVDTTRPVSALCDDVLCWMGGCSG